MSTRDPPERFICDPIKALVVALSHEGAPYRWGGKGPDHFDCSGAVTYAVWRVGGPDWRHTHNAQALYDNLATVTMPQTGDLAFYGSSPRNVVHVMFVTGDGRVYGAAGNGGPHIVTDEIAQAEGAKMLFRPRVNYRTGFLGYRRLQQRSTTAPGAPHA